MAGANLPKKPKQSFWDKARDQFDANTAADQYRRAQAGQPLQYRDQQAQRAQVRPQQVSFGGNNQFAGTPKASSSQPARPSQPYNKVTSPVVLPVQAPTPQLNARPAPISNGRQMPSKPTSQMTAEDYRRDPTSRFATSAALGIGRSLTGTAQSLSGLVDAVSPGEGQSQMTKNLNKNAESIDKRIKDQGLNSAIYKGGQIATDVATFFVPGGVAKGAVQGTVKVASKVPGAAKIASKTAQGADKLAKTGKVGGAAAGSAKYLAKPSTATNILADTGLNTGYRSAREQDISPGTIALDAGTSVATAGALKLAGKGIKAGASKVLDMTLSDDLLKGKPTAKEKATAKQASTANPQGTRPIAEFSDAMKEAADAEEARILKYRGFEKARAKGREISRAIYNPFSEAERFDALVMQAEGTNPKNASALSRLTSRLQKTMASGNIASIDRKLAGVDDVIRKYPSGTDREKDFITYIAAKRDVNIAENKGKRIFSGDIEESKQIVKDFESANPSAADDLGVLNKYFGDQAERAKGVLLDDASYKAAVANEDFYAPIARVIGSAEDALRPKIQANVLAGGSRQKLVRRLKGSSAPIQQTWDEILRQSDAVTKQLNQMEAYRTIYNAAEKGQADIMVRMGMTAEQSKTIIDANNALKELANQRQKLQGSIKKSGAAARKAGIKATAYNNKTQAAAVEKLAKSMEAFDPDGAAAVRGLKKSEQAQMLDWISTGMTDYQVGRGNKLNSAAMKAYGSLMDLRAQADELTDIMKSTRDSKNAIVGSVDDTRGRNVLRGLVDGYPTWVETTPEMMTMLQGLDQKELPGIIKGISNMQRVFRSVWTGMFNPLFAVKSKLFYDPAMMAINQSGARYQLKPSVILKSTGSSFKTESDLWSAMQREGALPTTGSHMVGDTKQTAARISSKRSAGARAAFYAKHPVQGLEEFDILSGRLAHSSRMQTALSAYEKTLANKGTREAAIANAADAYNNVLPNYAVTNNLIRTIDALVPYFGATISGNRAMTTAARRDPVAFGAKLTAFSAGLAAIGLYAVNNPETQEFYQDMYDSGNQQILSNNIVFVLPGKKPAQREDGSWENVVTIPIPPELRAPNNIVQNAIFTGKGGDPGGYNPNIAAGLSVATGGALSVNREGGVQSDVSPVFDSAANLVFNTENFAGKPLAKPGTDLENVPRKDQKYDKTSQLAISAANAWNKLPVGDISPLGVEKTVKSLGTAGKIANAYGSKLLSEDKSADNERIPKYSVGGDVGGQLSANNEKGMTDAKWHFKNKDAIRSTLTKDDLGLFDQVTKKLDTPTAAENKANILYDGVQGRNSTWRNMKELNARDAEKTGRSNPLYELTDDQARAVLLYRSSSKLNRAKQSYAKDGTALFQSLNLDERWYDDFKKSETAYWDSLTGGSESSAAAKTYSGKRDSRPSAAVQQKLDTYYNLPKGTGARQAFLAANPDVIAYWNEDEKFTNEERVAMGLDPLKDKGGSYGSSSGRGGGGGSRSPNSNQFLKVAKASGVVKGKAGGKQIAKLKATPKKVAKAKVTIKKNRV